MGVHRLPTENALSAEIGYALHRSNWGKGYGFEAVREGLRYIFFKTDIRRVVAHCRDVNAASIALLEKLKFRREGHFIEDVEVRGKLMSSYWYAMLRSEFIDFHSQS
jgi:ribosomal-protein-alanine N-acetyltransferase